MKRLGLILGVLLSMVALPCAAQPESDPFPFGVPEPVEGPPKPIAPAEPMTPEPVDRPAAPPAQPAPTWVTGAPVAGGYPSGPMNQGGPFQEEGPQPTERRRSGFVFVPKLAFLLAGFATLKNTTDCPDQFLDAYVSNFNALEIPYPPVCEPAFGAEVGEDLSLDNTSPILLAADALYHVVPSVRLGASVLWVPSSQVAVSSAAPKAHLGSEISVDATFEHLFADADNGALFYRLMVGPTLLFTSGDLEIATDREKKFCREFLKVCEVKDSPFFGYNLGAGLGALFPFGQGGLRTELLLNYVSLPFREVTATTTDAARPTTVDAKIEEEGSFVRLWLAIGTEI